ncbi:DUF7594 domain-containing protein [Nocardioides gansuensis]|uniref:CBM96 family carbohydrate-binding protein n=1 Tax=Nocardioides gansuensis TaxID=2138300 RepID=UPI001FE605E7|nr:DNRLRE domain-containing protein [Nocardioides gansuensis]
MTAADAWIDESSPATNLGNDSILKVRSQGPSGNFRALARFPAADPAPGGCVLQTATLRMYAASPGEDRTLMAVGLSSAWSESEVTWNNQPATDDLASSIASGSEQGYREWKVTAQVAAGAPHGFLIRDAAENDSGEQSFHGREKGENPPELVLRYAPPPDPSQGQLPPVPGEVACGQEIVASTLVTNDLTNCLGDGLVIGAPNITVDLAGHTIDGVGLGVGIRIDGFGEVTVRNGSVTDFDYGVQLNTGTARGLVEQLMLTANQVAAVELLDADGPAGGNTIKSNRLEGNGLGISLVNGTSGATVVGNTVLENAREGVVLHGSAGNVLDGNQFVGGSDRAIELFAASDNVLRGNSISGSGDGGIDVVAGSHRNLLEGNVLTATGDSGLYVSESDGNRLIENTAHGMSDNGITLSTANESVVRGNDVRFNAVGMELSGSSRNVVVGNVAGESLGNGIELAGGSFANTIRGNVVNRGGGDGIVVADDALVADQTEPGVDHANVVEGNTANENQGDGIEAAKGGHVLASNVTIGNGSWGIFAEIGTTGDGANVARGNGKPGQCFGIACIDGPPPPPDTVAPETEITAGPPAETDASTAELTFTGADETAGQEGLRFECALHGGPWDPCTSPTRYANLDVGAHVFAVRAVDAAGNLDPTPATYAWAVVAPPPPPDTTAPDTEITDAPPAETERTTGTFAFAGRDESSSAGDLRFECALDASAWMSCTGPVEYAELGVGAHEFAVRAVDAAGNADPTPATYPWTVVTRPPPMPECGPPITVSANADSWIDRSEPRRNRGSDTSMRVRDTRSADLYRTLVRFDLAADPPTGCEIAAATLRLYAGTWSQHRTLRAVALAGGWSEGTVTWANQPPATDAAAVVTSGPGWLEWAVAEHVQGMYDGANHGFLISDITSSGSGEQRLYSRERWSNQPQLVVTFTPIVE